MALKPGPLDEGTPEAAWVALLTTLPLHDGSLGVDRVIVLAPHPDDEILGCGGALQRWARTASLELWHVTSGERSHGPGADPLELGARRRAESERAGAELALGAHRRLWLGQADGQVHEAELEHALRLTLAPGSAVVAPLPVDGHPDHDAVGRAAQRAAAASGARATFYAVWAWHGSRPSDHAMPIERAWRMPLTPLERARKAHALSCFQSQLTPRGQAEAVLPPRVLAHFMRSDEVFFDGGAWS